MKLRRGGRLILNLYCVLVWTFPSDHILSYLPSHRGVPVLRLCHWRLFAIHKLFDREETILQNCSVHIRVYGTLISEEASILTSRSMLMVSPFLFRFPGVCIIVGEVGFTGFATPLRRFGLLFKSSMSKSAPRKDAAEFTRLMKIDLALLGRESSE